MPFSCIERRQTAASQCKEKTLEIIEKIKKTAKYGDLQRRAKGCKKGLLKVRDQALGGLPAAENHADLAARPHKSLSPTESRVFVMSPDDLRRTRN